MLRRMFCTWWTRHTIYLYRPGARPLPVRRVRGKWRAIAQCHALRCALTEEERELGVGYFLARSSDEDLYEDELAIRTRRRFALGLHFARRLRAASS